MSAPRFALVALLTIAAPAAAQQYSESYKFLQAIRDAKGDVVVQMLGQPGSTIVNTKDKTTGEGALHIIAKKKQEADKYMAFLLQNHADPNIRDSDGNTPLLLAISFGNAQLAPLLIGYRANVNLANSLGETPLILAVQRRDTTTAQLLIEKGADADKTDNVGMSARAYAARDSRSPEMTKLLAGAPKRAGRPVSGPKL